MSTYQLRLSKCGNNTWKRSYVLNGHIKSERNNKIHGTLNELEIKALVMFVKDKNSTRYI
jgi:hypothetical protein